MSFLNPAALIGLIGIPIIIILYLLKQKYKEIYIPSLFLWEEVFPQSESNKAWQKLRKNILMFLQIFIVLIIVLILAEPVVITKEASKNFIVVLDSSMSMQASDVNESRFAEAKRQIRELVSDMKNGSAASLIVMNQKPYIAINMTEDKDLFVGKLENIHVTNSGEDIDKTKNLIDMLYSEDSEIILYSDQNYDFGQAQAVNTVIIGRNAQNTGITNLSYYIDGDRIVALVKVKNFGDIPVQKTVSLFSDNKICDSKDIAIEAFSEEDVFFTNISAQSTELMALLAEEDVLAADDYRYSVVTRHEDKKVLLMTEQNIFLEKAIGVLPNLLLYVGNEETAKKPSGYYIYIFDGVLPEVLPEDGHILLINPPVQNEIIETEEEVQIGEISIKNSELFNGIPDFDFLINKSKKIITPDWAREIISSEETPVMLAGEKENRKIVILGFDLHQSDLPLRKEFPILMYNLFQWFTPKNIVASGPVKPLDSISFHTSPEADAVRVISPDGRTDVLAPPFPVLQYDNTNAAGFYILEETINNEAYFSGFAVNVDTAESDLFLNADNIVQESAPAAKSGRNLNLQHYLLIFLISMLFLEWWVYIRGF